MNDLSFSRAERGDWDRVKEAGGGDGEEEERDTERGRATVRWW